MYKDELGKKVSSLIIYDEHKIYTMKTMLFNHSKHKKISLRERERESLSLDIKNYINPINH